MLKYCYVPNSFGDGLTVPLPKDNSLRNLKNYDNFRGITISPLVSKIFENCVLSKIDTFLNSNDRQFGFKKEMSCNHALFTVKKTVYYFSVNNSTVNLCSLDISKAFDKVNYYALLLTLMDRYISRNIILILLNWFEKTFTVVRWNNCLSNR